MAFQTGTQVNAALGRTDYTPFLQGALQGAQAQGRAGELIGQGLANLGQQVGQGIEKYSEQKKKNAERDGRINATLGAIQANAKTLEKYGRKEEADALRTAGANILQETDLNKRAAMSQGVLESFLQGQQIESGARQRQLGEQAAQYSGLLEQSGGAPVSLESGPMSPIAQQQGRAMYLDNLYKQSQIAQNFAASNKQPIGQIMSLDEVENYKRAGFDVKSVPVGNGMLRVESVSPFGPTPTTTIKTGDDIVAGRTFDTLKAQKDVALAATNAISAYEDANKLLKGKVITGAGAEATLALNKALGFFGIQSQEVADTEVLKARLAVPVFSLVKQLGAGTGISNADREYAEMAAGGKITLDKNAIIRLVEIGRKASQNTVDSYNEALDEAYPPDNKDYTSARAVLKLRKQRTAAEIVGLPQ